MIRRQRGQQGDAEKRCQTGPQSNGPRCPPDQAQAVPGSKYKLRGLFRSGIDHERLREFRAFEPEGSRLT